MHDILEQASRAFDVPIKLIQSASRRPRYCTARFAVMYALREQGYSLAEIGEVLGNRDHRNCGREPPALAGGGMPPSNAH